VKLNKEVKVGLLAVVALTIFYLGFNFLKGKEVFSSNNSYYTIYDNCQGLSTSSPVLLNGMPVGRVKSLQILPHRAHNVLVAFETQRDIQLTDATQARLISPSLLGDKAIALLIKEGNPLKNYDTVPGKIEPSLGDTVIEGTLPALQDVQNISLLVNQFVANLIENTDRINSIFTNLEDTTRQLKETIDKNQHEFHTLSQNMSEVSSVLADRKDGVRPLLTKLNRLMEGVQGQEAEEILNKLNTILGSVGRMVEKTELKSNSLSRLLYDDHFYSNLNKTLGNLDKLVVDLKSHPWRYFNFSVFGRTRGHEQAETK
jgi:phospholipid/cholesterol/gamma-HCH transport system substrate-binding protein